MRCKKSKEERKQTTSCSFGVRRGGVSLPRCCGTSWERVARDIACRRHCAGVLGPSLCSKAGQQASPDVVEAVYPESGQQHMLGHHRRRLHRNSCEKEKSRPGPDGTPFAAWSAAPLPVKQHLLKLYRACWAGAEFPRGFNHSVTVLLPKDGGESTSTAIDRTRTIAKANTDAMLFAAATAEPLMHTAMWTVHEVQAGFIRGRKLASHVIESEGICAHWRHNYAAQAAQCSAT